MSAGLFSRSPARVRIFAAMTLPRYPTAPAPASAQRWSSGVGSMRRRTASTPATHGGGEDGGDHEQAGAALGALGPHQERDAQRDGGQRVTEIVDEVREQRDGAR